MLEDRLLVWELKRGKVWAFDRIYAKYLDTLLTVAVGLLGDAQLAEDIVQDGLGHYLSCVLIGPDGTILSLDPRPDQLTEMVAKALQGP